MSAQQQVVENTVSDVREDIETQTDEELEKAREESHAALADLDRATHQAVGTARQYIDDWLRNNQSEIERICEEYGEKWKVEKDAIVEDAKKTEAEIGEKIRMTRTSLEVTRRQASMMTREIWSTVTSLFEVFGITLGVAGQIIGDIMQMVVATISLATAETAATKGAAATQLAMAVMAMASAIAAQQKNDQAKAALEVGRNAIQFTRVVSMI
jgi:hypothetical protein